MDDDYQNQIDGNWRGSGFIYKLLNDAVDIVIPTNSIYQSNYKAHYEYKAVVTYPDEESYFEATATYEHSTLTRNFSPAIEISASGASASIGMDISVGSDERTVELPTPIHYTP